MSFPKILFTQAEIEIAKASTCALATPKDPTDCEHAKCFYKSSTNLYGKDCRNYRPRQSQLSPANEALSSVSPAPADLSEAASLAAPAAPGAGTLVCDRCRPVSPVAQSTAIMLYNPYPVVASTIRSSIPNGGPSEFSALARDFEASGQWLEAGCAWRIAAATCGGHSRSELYEGFASRAFARVES